MIITSIVDNYFRGKIKSQRLMIEGQQVQGHDVFTAVLYLKDKIYSYHSEMELCLFFGLAMLQWEQDDTICEIFNSPNSKVIEQASFSSDEYIL